MNCKNCDSSQFNIYPNGICQVCLSKRREIEILITNQSPLFLSSHLIDLYLVKKYSIKKIASQFNTTSASVSYWLKKYYIPTNHKQKITKSVDSNVFNNLTPESSFLLGYIFTDGDLLLNKKTQEHFIRIYSKHKDQLELVLQILKSDAVIQYRKAVMTNNIKQGEIYFIHIANQNIIKNLMRYGLVMDKNQSIKFPLIPEHLLSYFIRGCWMGSGSVYQEKKGGIYSYLSPASAGDLKTTIPSTVFTS